MNRIVGLVAALYFVGLGPAAWGDAPMRPNILWLTSEDNSTRWLGCYGNPFAQTPHLDRLAAEGFQYMHAYADAPVCAPSRSTWITGVLAVSMGTHPMRSYNRIPHETLRLYPDYLKDNGYYTGNWNKTDYNFGGREWEDCWDETGSVDWDALGKNQPFFQVINFFASHESRTFGDVYTTQHDPADTSVAPYHPDVPGMRENYALYHDAVRVMDGQIGEALARLEALGLADNTVVIYNSDHGGVLPRSKRFLFQSGLHCPLVIRIPEAYRALWPAEAPGSRVDRLVSFVDMPKTWLSITGTETPGHMQGRVFLGPDTEPEAAYHMAFRERMDERMDSARAVIDKRYLYIRNYMPYAPWMQKLTYLWNMEAAKAWEQAVSDGVADAVQAGLFAAKGVTEELYDMERDPDNVVNLAARAEHQAVLAQMRSRLRERQLEVFDSGLLPESERVRLAEKHETTIYEMVRNPAMYDLAGLLDAADLALAADPSNAPALRAMLGHEHVGMRYWGVVGAFLIGDVELGRVAVEDPSHEVRAMAAWLLTRAGEGERGVACLEELLEQDSYALLTVLNVIDWMGEEGRALLPAVRALEFEEAYPKQHEYKIQMRDLLLEKFVE